jgi:adenylate cyclase
MCSSVDRELLASSEFRGRSRCKRAAAWSPPAALRCAASAAQDLFTLDPAIAAEEVIAGHYERYLAD